MKRLSDRLMAILFAGGLLALMCATILLPKNRYSYYENRNLADFPEISRNTVLSGQVFDDLETMFCDYAAGRTSMLKLRTWADLNLFHRPVVNDVVVTEDTLLPYRAPETVDASAIAAQAELVAADNRALQDLIEGYGGTYLYVAVPCQYAYYADTYPWYLDSRADYTAAELSALTEAMTRQGVNFLDMGPVFDALGHGEAYSSRVDNHYGLYGAYETYRAAVNAIAAAGGPELDFPEEGTDLTFSALPNPYMGSRTRKLMGLRGNGEHLLTAEFTAPLPFTRQDNGADTAPTVYALPADEDAPVLYALYMGGDIAETVLSTDRPDRPDGLIFGDSFTNAVECLAYYSFDQLRSLDLRHDTDMTLTEYIKLYRPEVVICIRDYEALLSRDANGDLS